MKIRVAVVFGGRSGEHEISLRSARAVISHLDPDRYQTSEFLIGKDGKIKKIFHKVKPDGHAEEVYAALAEA